MTDLIETIRAAVAADASDDARSAGAQACRTILAALEAKPGEPLADPPRTVEAPQAAHVAQAIAGVIRGMTPEQLLDLAISRLKAALPPGATVAPAQPVKFQLIPVAPMAIPPRKA